MPKNFSLPPFYIAIIIFLWFPRLSKAQEIVHIQDDVKEHFFTYNQIEQLADPEKKFSFDQIRSAAFQNKFKASKEVIPFTTELNSTNWYRIKIRNNQQAENKFLLEFFDQTIDDIVAFIPDGKGGYQKMQFGDKLKFKERLLHHKNFEILLDNNDNQAYTYYFRISSSQTSAAIIVLRTFNWFVTYALGEYFYFGIFYGMILVFSFYNLMMFFVMRERQYLYYVLYVLSVALFEMSNDGIAFQYLWPNAIEWNEVSFAFALCAISVFALLFTKEFLIVKKISPKLDKLITIVVIVRILFLIVNLLWFRDLLTYKFLDFIPLAVAFYTGIYVLKKGYLPARFFVLGYSFLSIGFMIKLLIMLSFRELNFNAFGHYSLSFCFVLEMILLSIAIGDKLRILRQKKQQAQAETIRQMAENAVLKDTLNQNLEIKVEERTREVFQKSIIIEAKNEELQQANELLRQQAAEIERMNILLEQDNQELQINVQQISRARVMSADVDFEEFSKIYPDKEHCNLFLADLKWKNGYQCKKCKNNHYYNGHLPHSRRCSKCSYEESVTSYTIFHNTRIPINKAFYMVFLIFTSKGKISSHKLSELLNIRQSTCWTYGAKIKAVMDDRKAVLKKTSKNGWSQLVLD